MDSSTILIYALSVAVLALLAVIAARIAYRRQHDQLPPSRIAYVPIVITAVGIIFILSLQLAKPNPATVPMTENNPAPSEGSLTEICIDREISENNQNRYFIKKDVCLTGYERVDSLIAAEIKAQESKFLEDIAAPEAQPLSIQFALDIQTTEFSFDRVPAVQSIKMTIYKNIGAARPNQEFKTWTFDRLTDRLIDFDVLFQEEHNPLWTIYPMVKAELMAKPYADEDLIDSGTGEDDFSNYENFTIEDGDMVFYFAPGQVAAGVAGPQRIALPLDDLQVILRPPFLDLQELYDEEEMPSENTVTPEEISADCESEGGNWLAEYDECEYIGKQWCDEYGASFYECESACRNDPAAQICTLQCVPVCRFE